MKKVGSHLLDNTLEKIKPLLKNQCLSISLVVGYIIILIMDCNFVYSQYIPNIYFQIPKYIIAAFFLCKTALIDWKMFTSRTKAIISIIFTLLAIQSTIGKDTTLMQVFILSIGSYGVSFQRILEAALFGEGFTLVVIIVLALIGVIPNWIYDRYEGGVVRQSLGLQYPTYIAIATTMFTLYYLYYRKKQIKWPEYIILAFVNILSYLVTDTRAMLFWSLVSIAVYACLNNNLHERFHLAKRVIPLTKYLVLLCAAIAVIATVSYQPENKLHARVNYSLSSRLSLGKRAVDTHGIKLFGSDIEWIGSSLVHEGTNNGKRFNIVDSFYVRTLVAYGIVSFIIIILAIEATMLRAHRENNIYLIVTLSILIVQAILDQYIIQVQWNIFALLFFQSFLVVKHPLKAEKHTKILKHQTNRKLSIILPVYNSQQYLKPCVEQLEKIKNIHYEIIIINDGSTDKTAKVAKEVQSSYNNIKLINNRVNRGVSHARNLGVKKSSGDYVICVDVDDEVNPTMYELLLKNADLTKSNISMCDYYEVINNRKHVSSKYHYTQREIRQQEAIKEYLLDRISNNVWDKVIDKKILSDITFNKELHVGEDILYCLEIFNRANKVSQLPDELLGYVQNSKSVMHSVNQKLTEYKNVIKLIPPKLKHELEEKYPDEFSYFQLEMIVRGIHAISLAANKNNVPESTTILSNFYTDQDLQRIIKNKLFPKSIRLEMWILLHCGINMHLKLMPAYQLIKEVTR